MIDITYLLLFLASFAVFMLLIGWRFRVSCLFVQKKISLWRSIEAMILSVAVNLISPFKVAGAIVKPYFLKRTEKMGYEKALSAVLIEQIFDNIPQLIIVIFSVYYYVQAGISAARSAVILAILFCLLFFLFYMKSSIRIVDRLLRIVNYLPWKLQNLIRCKTPIKHKRIIKALNLMQKSPSKTRNLLVMTFIAAWLAFQFPLLLSFFFKTFHIDLAFFQAFAVFWIPFFVGKVSGVPSGLGVRDGAMIAMLVTYGISVKDATFMTIAFRVALAALNLIFGVMILAKYGIRLADLRKARARKG